MINPYVHIPYHRIEEYLHFIKKYRINLEILFSSHSLDRLKKSDIFNLKEKLDYQPSFTIHAPFMDLSPGAVDSKVRQITIERFLQVFEIAEILMPVAIVFHSGYEKWKYALKVDTWLKHSLMTWNQLIKIANDKGIKIAIENIFEEEPSNLRLLMEEIGSDNFGICFDTGHCNLFTKVPLETWLNELKPYITELHLHDNNGKADDHLAICDGTFDFSKLFSEFKNKDLIYTIEAHSPGGVLKSIERLKEYIQ